MTLFQALVVDIAAQSLDPNEVRTQLSQSGLSESEIRQRLQAAGYSSQVLDLFLSDQPLDEMPITGEALSALESLGVVGATPDGLELVPLETGMEMGLGTGPVGLGESPIFGFDVFTRATSQFQPLLYGPVPDSYVLGPGDQVVLVLAGEVELAHELEVTRAGFVVIPNVGQVPVANLTMGELRAQLRSRLAGSYSGIERGTTSFNVTLSEIRTIQVSVAGEVNQPGAYQLASVATVLNSLYAAAGPTEIGNMRSVRVERRNGERHELDLYPYLTRGDVSNDITLENGDVVFVPLKGRRVKMLGAVVRPAHFELSDTDDLIDVLQMAGGFAPQASRQRLTLHRVVGPAFRGPGLTPHQAIDLELRPSRDSSSQNYLGGVLIPPIGLQDGDSIVVDEVPSLVDSYFVSVSGMVRSPGAFPWEEGMTLRNLLELARGPTVGADLRQAQVSRLPMTRESGNIAETIDVPLDSSYLTERDMEGRYAGPPGVEFPSPGTSPEFQLEPFDRIRISPQPSFEMPEAVLITGEVAVTGEYTLVTTTDRVASLVGRAGGLLDTAYPEGARLFRAQDELGRIDLDLPTALVAPGGTEDLALQPGDSLHIPEYSPTVRVLGAVNSPVTVLYREGEDLEYYIGNAGGYRSDADEGRVSVRYANGQAEIREKVLLFWSRSPTPGPGSEVLVPAEVPDLGPSLYETLTPLVGMMGTVTALILAVTR